MTKITSLFALFSFVLLAQPGHISTNSIAVDSAGGIYAGTSASATISKLVGKVESWHVSLSSSPQDQVLALSLDAEGNVFAAGTLAQGGFIAKLSAGGERIGFASAPVPVRALAVGAGGAIYAGGAGYIQKFDTALRPDYRKNIAGSATGLAVDAAGILHAAIASPDGKALAIEFAGEGEVVSQLDLGPATPAAIIVDAAGSVYVTGSTASLDFPARNGFANHLNGPSDAFVVKIVNGAVEWSTYLGGRGDDTGTALAFDRSGNLVVAGYTTSCDFPGAGTGEPWHGGEDAFVTQFDGTGAVVQTTYAGTAGNDRALALVVDGQGNAHVSGWSKEQSQQPLMMSTRLKATQAPSLKVLQPRVVSTIVTTLADTGTGSLRDVVANVSAGSTITFQVTGTITLASRILINKNLTLSGPGAASLTISGGGTTRLFFIQSGTVAISGVTLANGFGKGGSSNAQTPGGGAAGMGGAIFQNGGSLAITSVVFDSNKAVGGNSNSVFVGNNSGGGGGFGGDAPTVSDVQPGGSGGDLGGTGGAANAGGTAGAGAGGGGGQSGSPGGNGGFGGGGGAANCGNAGDGGFGGGAGEGCNTSGTPGFGGGTASLILFSGAGGGAGFGGAIFVRSGTATIQQSTFENNQAIGGQSTGGVPGDNGQGKGGAVFAYQGSTVSISNSTFIGNIAAQAGVNSTNGYNGTSGGAKLCPGVDNTEICGTVSQTANVVQTSAIASGDNQTGATTRTFPIALAVRVTNSGTPASGVAVTFTVQPNGGASGTLVGGSTTLTVNTDNSGYATARLVANSTPGSFTVTAFGQTFHLTTAQCVNNPQVSVATDSVGSPATNSLRWAVNKACAGQTVTFAPAVTNVTLAGDTFNGRLRIDDNLTITGNGAAQTTVSGGDATRLFFIQSGNVAINNLTLSNGLGKGGDALQAQIDGGGAAGMGGAIFQNGGTVTVTGVVFASNKAVGGSTVLGSVGNQDGSGGGGGFGGNSVYSGANAGFGTGGSGGDLGGFGGDPGNITPGDGAGGGASGQIHPGADGGFGGGGGAANCGAGGNGGFGGGGGSDCGGTPGHGGFGGGNGISTLTFAMAGGGAGFGGAIFVRAGSLLVNSSSFSANQAIGGNLATSFAGQGKGGALFIYQGATVRLNNVTFSGSVAAEAGVNSPNAYDGTPQGAKLCPGADDVNICGSVKLTVGPPTLTGTVGVSYNSGVAITGGTPPFQVTLGSALPDGLTLTAATGAIAGIPTKAGVFTVPFSVADADISVGFTSTFTIAQGTQTITFAPLSDKVFGAAPFSVSATVSSGLAVTFSSLTPGVCTVAGSTVTLVNLGTCTIHATQIGSADYLPATPVDRSFQVLLAPPGSGQPFVTGQTTGTVRNNFSGFVGMQITVGTSPINVTKLGRIYLSGNNQTHTLKLVNVSTGADVAGGSVQLTMTAGTPNTYQYATLANAVQLLANTSYYLVSQESQGGDTWYDYTPITVTADAKVDGPVFQSGATYTQVTGSKNFSFVPPNFQYTVATVTPPPAVTITSPQANGTVSGQSVLLSATATAAPSLVITSVQFKVDADTLIGSAVTAPPYQVTWDSTTVPDGVHAITAVATDNTGGSTTSQPVQVNVSNGGVQAAGTEFVTSIPSSSLRSNYTGYVGMQFTVGPQNVTINGLGRVYVSGNSATHIVKLVDAANGQDVTGGSVSLNMTGGTAFKFKYAALASPLLLPAGTSYYLVSQETSGGDQWYDYGPVTSTNAASINGPVYLAGANYALVPAAVNQSFVPVSFLYSVNVAANTPPTVTITSPSAGMVSGTVAFNFTATASGGLTITSVQRKLDGVNFGSSIPGSSSTLSAGTPLDTTLLANGTHTLTGVATDSANNTATSAPVIITVNNAAPPSTAFITGQTFGTPRNNFSGFVGMQFTTGASTLSVTQLGRICVAGNSQAHNVKLVLAATGADVANGAVSIAMSGCTAGQYKYASLGSAVSLPANTAYYLVSQETSGGDQWYDYAPVTSSTGTVNGPVYFAGGYVSVQSPGSSFVPVNFQYNVSNTPPPTVSITTPAAGPVSGTITVTANAIATGGLTIQTVQFQLNNTNLGAPVSGAGPNYSVQLDTTTLINGSTYNLTAVATDSANNSSSSPAVAVTINNSVPPAGSPLIIGQSLGTLRNNFTGFVGMQFTTTATAIVANSLGRMCVAGNSGSHTLKLVKYDGTDLPGGTTTVNMAGCTPGQYKYASLTIPLQLNANTTYYLVSQEQTGGDQWYDYGPVTPAPGIATVNGPVYYTNIYNLVSSPGYSYVPVNLLYQ